MIHRTILSVLAMTAALFVGTAHADPPVASVHLSAVRANGAAVAFTLTRSPAWKYALYPRGCRNTTRYIDTDGATVVFREVYWPTGVRMHTDMGMPSVVAHVVSVRVSCGMRHLSRRRRWLKVTRMSDWKPV